jgi:hypothetical protein
LSVAAGGVVAVAATCVILTCAGSASVNWRIKVMYLVSRKLRGNLMRYDPVPQQPNYDYPEKEYFY